MDLSEIADRLVGPGELQVPGYTVKRSIRADRRYLCPYCQGWIERGSAHVVAYPSDALDERRHYHTPCWAREKGAGSKPNSR